jgi:hypothetical protein
LATERTLGVDLELGHIILDIPSVEVRLVTEEEWLPPYLINIFSAGFPTDPRSESEGARHSFVYRVVEIESDAAESGWRVQIESNQLMTAKTRDELVTGLENIISDRVARSLNEYQLFHSGALSRNGKGILIPGQSGAGKSTTSAALAFGGFEYFSDDVAVFGPDGTLRPFPKVLAMKYRGWEVISNHYPETSEAVVFSTGGKGVTYLQPPFLPSEVSSAGVPIDLIFIPRRDDVAAPVIEKISKSDVVKVLTQESLDLELRGQSAFDFLINLTQGAECYALNVLDLSSAIGAVKDLTD